MSLRMRALIYSCNIVVLGVKRLQELFRHSASTFIGSKVVAMAAKKNSVNLLLLGLCLCVRPLGLLAHVRMAGRLQKFGSTILPIRNANAIGADGQASVGGPCGGVNNYKAEHAADVL